MAPEGSSATEIGARLVDIESGTTTGILDQAGSTYALYDRLGRDRLAEVLGAPAGTSDEDLRAAIRELHRRTLIAELGLDSNASFAEISEEKDRRALAARIEEFGLEPDATWRDIADARDRA